MGYAGFLQTHNAQPTPINGAAMVANNAFNGSIKTPKSNAKVAPKKIRKQTNAVPSAKFLIIPNPLIRRPRPNLQR